MTRYEYKVVPAPQKGTKAKGVKTPEARFANSVELLLNELAEAGWEYQRAELLPSEERSGLTGSTTNWRNVLVFRRVLDASRPAAEPEDDSQPAAAPVHGRKEPAAPSMQFRHAEPRLPPLTATAGDPESPPEATPVPGPGAARMAADDGVEELSPVSGMTAALRARAVLTATKPGAGNKA